MDFSSVTASARSSRILRRIHTLQPLPAEAWDQALTRLLARQLRGYRLERGVLYEHSRAVAEASFWLTRQLNCADDADAYACGLVHDLGKLALNACLLPAYNQVVEAMWKRKLTLSQAESELLGIDHAEAGAAIAARLGLPAAQVDVIRWHHIPGQARRHPELAAIVHIANAFAPQESLGLASLENRQVNPDALRILRLDRPALEGLRRSLREASSPAAPGELLFSAVLG